VAKKKKAKERSYGGVVSTNRRAHHKYEMLEKFECGIQLQGSEVKSLREGSASINEAYAIIEDGQVWLHGMHIPPYTPAAMQNHQPERVRKLLMHRREIERLIGQIGEKGLTLVPTKVYFSGAYAKVEISLARGKQAHDKRHDIKEREMKREMDREVRRRR